MKEFKGYHGANQAVPSIDPELMQDSNAKITEILGGRNTSGGKPKSADDLENLQLGLHSADDHALSPGGHVSPENRSRTTVRDKDGNLTYDSSTATPEERKAFAERSKKSREKTKAHTARQGAFRARKPAGSGRVKPLIARIATKKAKIRTSMSDPKSKAHDLGVRDISKESPKKK